MAVCVFIIPVKFDGIKSCCHYDSSVFLCHDLILLVIINGSCLAYFGTDTAFTGLEFQAMLPVDYRNIWDCLGKRRVDGCPVVQASVEFVRDFFGRTFLLTDTAACTFVHVDTACFFADINSKISYETGNLFHLTVCIDIDLFVGCSLHHFRGKDTCGTVQSREGFVKL